MKVVTSSSLSQITSCAAPWVIFLAATLPLPSAYGYTPNSPEVREMLARAMAYLEKAPLNGAHSGRLGGQALMGLAAYKYDKRFGNGGEPLPRLTEVALTRAVNLAATPANLASEDNYSIGITLIFLTEVHPTEHTGAINAYLADLKARQKPNGSWGYSHETRGDTSQLQYAVLGAWAAKQVGLQFSNEMMADVVNYLLRVQDPSGAWGYQGNDPGTFTRVPQTAIRPSLVAAGLGSVYVAADFLGMSKGGTPRKVSNAKLPPALIPVLDEGSKRSGRLAGTGVEADRMRQAMNDGNDWFRQNPGVKTALWQYYFLYALERYHSFREKVEGSFEEEPRWYNEGVRLMQGLQREDGAFGFDLDDTASPIGCDLPVGTAFAMLFLLRSTRETIEKVIERDGILRGGYDLPSDLTEVRMRDNKLVAPAITGEVEDLITMLEDDEAEKIENLLENPDALSLSGLQGTGREYSARLARVLRTGSYKARIVAARSLGRQGDLDNVPILIYALTDGDPRVVVEARNGLRLTSRKFEGFGLPDSPSAGELQSAVSQWKAWYKSVRPDAVFIE